MIHGKDFFAGAGYRAFDNSTVGLVSSVLYPDGDPQNKSKTYQAGAVFADLLSILNGVATMEASFSAGVVITGISGGTAGIVAVPAGVAGFTYGAGVSAKSAKNLGNDLGLLFSKGSGSPKGAGKISGKDIVFSDKFKKTAYENQVTERGWTNESIVDVINKPYKTASAVNKYTKNSVTVYFKDKTHYVAVDNGTGKVIQVSDLNKLNWKFDPNFSKQVVM